MKEIKRKPLKVVVDTNLFVSALISKGSPAKVLEVWKEDKFSLVMADLLFLELQAVLNREKILHYGISKSQVFELLEAIKLNAIILHTLNLQNLPVQCRDPKDEIVLAAAFASEADYLVTGDEDLLILKDELGLGKLKIVTARQFLQIFDNPK